ncbi:MAG: hypothetical protein ACLPY5_02550 [Candidatus Bathyarchaeia archaeon]
MGFLRAESRRKLDCVTNIKRGQPQYASHEESEFHRIIKQGNKQAEIRMEDYRQNNARQKEWPHTPLDCSSYFVSETDKNASKLDSVTYP